MLAKSRVFKTSFFKTYTPNLQSNRHMKYLIRIEEAVKFGLTFYSSIQLGFSPWTYLAFLLLPDVSMVGYLVNTKVGAYAYNLVHHQGIGLIVLLIGYLLEQPALMFTGLILVGHSSMDRMLGYGLKYGDDFKNTHLGWIGKQENIRS